MSKPSLPTLFSYPMELSHEISNKKNFTKKKRALASVDIPVFHDRRHLYMCAQGGE